MTDVFSKAERSRIMGRISGKNTKPEKIIRSYLHKKGYRFRLHCPDLPGKPDICLPKYKTVIFINGCYWHRHPDCARGRSMPGSNIDFWQQKFSETVDRDERKQRELSLLGWNIITIWECEIKKTDELGKKIILALEKNHKQQQRHWSDSMCVPESKDNSARGVYV